MADRRATLSRAMARMMLEGQWGMSSIVCPRDGCGTPLLRNRSGELYCAGCDMRVVVAPAADEDGQLAGDDASDDQQHVAPRNRVPSGVRQRAQLPQPAPAAEQAAISAQASRPAASAPAPSPAPARASSDVVSKRLGEKLLRGWRMLGDTCADCNVPLMQAKDDRRTHCVSCERFFDPAGAAVVPSSAPAAAAAAAAAPASGAAAVASSAFRAQFDDVDDDDSDDEEARALQMRLLNAHAARAQARAAEAARLAGGAGGASAAGGGSVWADALAEVASRTAADEASGPGSATAPPAAAAAARAAPPSARPLMAARVVPAPANWHALSDDAIRQLAQQQQSGSVAASPAPASATQAPAVAALLPSPARAAAPAASPVDGAIGPSGAAAVPVPTVFTVTQPTDDAVRRMAAALERAQVDELRAANGSAAAADEDAEADRLAARVSGARVVAGRGGAVATVTSHAEVSSGTRAQPPQRPAQAAAHGTAPLAVAPAVETALAALGAQLAREAASVAALGQTAAGSGAAAAAAGDAIADAAARLAKLASGIEALRRLAREA